MEVYDDGSLRCESQYVDGVRDGMQTCWYPSGVKMKQSEMKNDVTHGEHLEWDEHGKIRPWAIARRGFLVEEKFWQSDGVLAHHRILKAEDKEGLI